MFCCFNNMSTTNQGYTWADLISSLWFENLTLFGSSASHQKKVEEILNEAVA